MSQYFQIHPDNPQGRLITQAVEIIRAGGVIAYPTDSAYALGCQIGNKDALQKIRRIRKLAANHNFTLVCRDLSELATYAKVNNEVFRLLKQQTPGPYTFILKGTNEVPRRLLHSKRRTIGLRVPNNAIVSALLESLGEPIMSVTLILPDDEYPLSDPYDIREALEHELDLVIDGGYCGPGATTVIDLVDEVPQVVREGKGSVEHF